VPTVLVVDDEEGLRELVRVNLELAGYDVVEAADGEHALEQARRLRPSVILLDVMMPGMDGWEVLRRIKADPDAELATVPVIMLTARAGRVDRIQGGIEGAVRYVTKPFALAELEDAVVSVLGGEPEPELRRRVQRQALADLAWLEKGGSPAAEAPRPRLTRLDREPGAPVQGERPAGLDPARLAGLSVKQRALLRAVGAHPTVQAAASELGVSRAYVYASLRRIGRRLGLGQASELIGLVRAGAFEEALADEHAAGG
jgi:CheY-like chemotaxis protein